jgi:hypothetical protein
MVPPMFASRSHNSIVALSTINSTTWSCTCVCLRAHAVHLQIDRQLCEATIGAYVMHIIRLSIPRAGNGGVERLRTRCARAHAHTSRGQGTLKIIGRMSHSTQLKGHSVRLFLTFRLFFGFQHRLSVTS